MIQIYRTTLVSLFAGLALSTTPAFAKKQFVVPSELEAYRNACPSNKPLIESLSKIPEATEYLRLMREAGTFANRYFLQNSIACHAVLVPTNDALRDIVVTDSNRDEIALVLAYHSFGATILEESDFGVIPARIQSRTGNFIELSRARDGAKLVNRTARVLGGEVNEQGSTYLIIDRIISPRDISQPSIVESILNWPNIYSNGFTPLGAKVAPSFYQVLENVTGKPGLSFIEVAELCGFKSFLEEAGTEKTVLLPGNIQYTNVPILRDLFSSDKGFVCNAFSSNVLRGRYTFQQLRALAQSDAPFVETFSGKTLELEYVVGWRGRDYVRIGEEAIVNAGGISGLTEYIVNNLYSSSYVVIESQSFADLN